MFETLTEQRQWKADNTQITEDRFGHERVHSPPLCKIEYWDMDAKLAEWRAFIASPEYAEAIKKYRGV